MTHDVHEPLSHYRDQLKDAHARNTVECFEELVAHAGIDADANAASVAKIERLAAEIHSFGAGLSLWKALQSAVIALALGLLVPMIVVATRYFLEEFPPVTPEVIATSAALWSVAVIIFILNAKKIAPRIKKLKGQLTELQENQKEEIGVAWQQMKRLNALFEWDTIGKVIEKSLTNTTLDPYFDNARLNELRTSFGWSDEFNKNKSVLYAHSGAINGNPFLLAETLDFEMSSATYTGSLSITWQERTQDAQGKTRWVTRHQTLHATVTKPAPAYTKTKFLIFGNEAAPDLTFTRKPTNLAHVSNTISGRWRKRRARKKLESFARNLDDDSNFTLMANREFETLFNAIDRNHEVQFRLLFTPLAQQQMVKLLEDREVGYGDNFTFIKSRMINLIIPAHLRDVDISAAPHLFQHYDLRNIRERFNDYSNTFFNAFYFTLAPLFTIPIYQQHRSHGEIYKDVYAMRPSYWEHESLANFHGEEVFRHPQSITRNILKISESLDNAEDSEVKVTAYGFRGEERVDYIAKLGGDGRMHRVPVHWTEYLPVRQTSRMLVREAPGATQANYEKELSSSELWRDLVRSAGSENNRTIKLRRSLLSVVPIPDAQAAPEQAQ